MVSSSPGSTAARCDSARMMPRTWPALGKARSPERSDGAAVGGCSMGKTGDHSSASDWLEALRTTETADRRWKRAVRALTAMGLSVVPALIEATGDDHPEVRRGVGAALRKIGPAIIPFLIKALRHDNWLVRRCA